MINETGRGSARRRQFDTLGIALGISAIALLASSAQPALAQDVELARRLAALEAQIAIQKAQIASLKSSMKAQEAGSRRSGQRERVAANGSSGASSLPPYPAEGFQPVIGFADKKLHFNGLTITPGGFLAFDTILRTRNDASDNTTNFGTIPFRNNPVSHTGEARFSVRNTRLAVLAEGNISPSILASGYVETDFYGAGTNSNFAQSASFPLRVRNAYTNIDFLDSGFHVLAGQSWSLLAVNSKGITPRNEVFPPTIDGNIMPGYTYARQPGIRLTKDFDKTLWLSVALEQSASLISGCNTLVSNTGAAIVPTSIPGNGVANVTCVSTANSGFAQGGQTQQLSINNMPDVIGKAAYELHLSDRDVHVEGFGIYRNYSDRVNYGTFISGAGYSGGSANKSSDGYGIGGAIVAPVIPGRLDFLAQGMIGRGMGRYTSTSLPDATLNGQGGLSPIRNASLVAGLTYHVTPEIDVYGFGGFDKVDAKYESNGAGGYVGYGAPNLNNSGCAIEGGVCAGVTGSVWQLTGGVWDKIFQGPYGYVRAGIQYSFTTRTLLAGSGTAAGNGPRVTPSVSENTVLTTLRFYPF